MIRTLALALFLASALAAQAAQYVPSFTPLATASLSVSTTSGRVALPATGSLVYLCNTGTNIIFYALGDTSVVATLDRAVATLAPGACVEPSIGSAVDVAGITGTGTSTLSAVSGNVSLAPNW